MSELWIICCVCVRRRSSSPSRLSIGWYSRAQATASATQPATGVERRRRGQDAPSTFFVRSGGLPILIIPRFAGLNEFLAQTGLRISLAALGLVDGLAWRRGRFGAVAVSLPSVGGRERRLGRRPAGCRHLFVDRSPTADRSLHRPIAGRAEHHRAQFADRPPVCERDRPCLQGNARPDRRRTRHDRRGNCVRSGCHDGRRQSASSRRPG